MKKTIAFVLWFICTGLATADINQQLDKQVPACHLTVDAVEKIINLKQLKNQVLYIDFWASWCPPCVKSFPFMNELHNQYSQQGLKVVAVNLDENKSEADKFLNNHPVNFTIAYDNQNRDCAQAFAVQAMPSSYLVDRSGVIQHVHLGFKSAEVDSLSKQIVGLLE